MTFAEALANKDQHYTYADYLTWGEDVQCELIDGKIYMMSPAPKPIHQEIHRELSYLLTGFLKGKKCKLYYAPFDVRLDPDADDENEDFVVQPDLFVVCDKSKIDDKGCKGAPDLVIEILSPSTAKLDYGDKLFKYMNAGVKEYWIVSPENKTVQVYLFSRDGNTFQTYTSTDTMPSKVLEGLKINLADVFEQS